MHIIHKKIISISGQESSDVKVTTTEGEFSVTVTSYSVKKLNVSGNLALQLRSSKPIQVMCLTSISNLWNTSSLNLFTVFPVEPSFCNWLEISSSCFDKACVIVTTKKTSVSPFVSINGSLVTATNYSFGDYTVLEIANLHKGVHFLKITNSAGLAVFVLNKALGRLYQVQPLIEDQCSYAFLSSINATTTFHLDDNNKNTTVPNVTLTFQDGNKSNFSSNHTLTSVSDDSYETTKSSSINPTLNTTTEKSAFVEVTTTLVKTTKTTLKTANSSENGKRDQKIEIGGISFQFQTNQNTSNSSQHTVIGGVPSYNIFFQDVEEDDYSQEYMMAVVLSLCVAIFAVIAVISSFLLMEFISRQKQIRNTKIRPFVS